MKKDRSVVTQGVGKKKASEYIIPVLMLLPSLGLFCTFNYYPFIKTIFNSFSIVSMNGKFIEWAGVDNWLYVLNSPSFKKVLTNTFTYAAIDFGVTFTVAMFFALLCAQRGKGARLYQLLFGFPLVISSTSIAAVWNFLFRQDSGLLNQILGTDRAWLQDPKTALFCVAFAAAWGHVAGRFLYLLVGFRNVSTDLIEASRIDGAGWWTRTFKIMLPMASPQIFYVLFVNIIGSFKSFSQIKLMTGGGPAGATSTLIWSVYENAYISLEVACVYAIILFVIIFAVTRIQFIFEKKMVFYQ